MNKRLSKTDFLYLKILYVIWNLISFYSEYLSVDVYDNPTDCVTDIETTSGITHITFQFPLLEGTHSCGFISSDILNEHLTMELNADSILKPYCTNDTAYDRLCAVYIDELFTHNRIMEILNYSRQYKCA